MHIGITRLLASNADFWALNQTYKITWEWSLNIYTEKEEPVMEMLKENS